MRRSLFIIAAALLALSVAVPALADVQFLYGGQFRFRINSGDNVWDGTSSDGYYGNYAPQTYTAFGKPNSYYNSNDNRFFLDQRLRLYFTFVGSKNLKVVTKFEIGDTKWGDPGDSAGSLGERTGQNGGGEIGADQVAIEVKNVYMEFNIPNTCSTALIGVQTLALLDSWIIDDDFAAAVLLTDVSPFRIAVGYIGGQYGAERRLGSSGSTPPGGPSDNGAGLSNSYLMYTNQGLDVDDFFAAVDFSCAPWKFSLIGFYQDGHQTNVSVDRSGLSTPVTNFIDISDSGFMPNQADIKDNNLFDFGLNATYKTDWLLGYLNFSKNFGSVEYNNPIQQTTIGQPKGAAGTVNGVSQSALSTATSSDYTGWMIDAGGTFFCPPYTFNLGGFYTTGPKFSDEVQNNGNGMSANTASTVISTVNGTIYSPSVINTVGGLPFKGMSTNNVTWYTQPIGAQKYSSEIMGGGVLADDMWVLRGYPMGLSAANLNPTGSGAVKGGTFYWESYPYPSNVWTITTGASWQLCPGTKLSASYWYWGTSDSVPVAYNAGTVKNFPSTTNVYASTTFAASSKTPGVFTKTVTTDTVVTPSWGGGAGTVTSTSSGPLTGAGMTYEMSDSLGHELNFYLDQQIVDNLTLTLVAAYMFTGDAFNPLPYSNGQFGPSYQLSTVQTQVFPNSALPAHTTTVVTGLNVGPTGIINGVTSVPIGSTVTDANKYLTPQNDNAWKLGARLQWNF